MFVKVFLKLTFDEELERGGGEDGEEGQMGDWVSAELAAASNAEHLERERKKEKEMEDWRERQRQKVINGGLS